MNITTQEAIKILGRERFIKAYCKNELNPSRRYVAHSKDEEDLGSGEKLLFDFDEVSKLKSEEPKQEEEYVTIKEAEKILGVKKSAVHKLKQVKNWKAKSDGYRIYLLRSQVEAYVNETNIKTLGDDYISTREAAKLHRTRENYICKIAAKHNWRKRKVKGKAYYLKADVLAYKKKEYNRTPASSFATSDPKLNLTPKQYVETYDKEPVAVVLSPLALTHSSFVCAICGKGIYAPKDLEGIKLVGVGADTKIICKHCAETIR